MKVSKIFGFVLCLHLGVIAVLIVQPGCSTTQPPTQTYEQRSTIQSPSGTTRSVQATDGLIPATRVDGLDSAFNAGLDDEGLYEPRRPGMRSDFGVDPLDPLPSESMTVDVAGPSYDSYTVVRGDSLWKISQRTGVSLDELYAANNMNKNSVLRIGQEIRIPVEGASARVATGSAEVYQPTTLSGSMETYTVQAGDTLSRIANRYDTTVRAIKAANNKSSDMIRVGEQLSIPAGANAGSGTTATPPPASTRTSSGASAASGNYRTHTVQSGEFPATIARRYGMTTNELLALNGITDPRSLQVGTELRVSASGSAANVDSRTETVRAPAARTTASPAPAPQPSSGPLEIRVVEADPLIESEAAEIDTDAMFEDAVEIPVIRLEDE